MSELKFATEEAAIQHLSNITGQRILIAGWFTNFWTKAGEKLGIVSKEYGEAKRLTDNLADALAELAVEIQDNTSAFAHAKSTGDINSKIKAISRGKTFGDIKKFLSALNDLVFDIPEGDDATREIYRDADKKIMGDIKPKLREALNVYQDLAAELKDMHRAVKHAEGIDQITDGIAKKLFGPGGAISTVLDGVMGHSARVNASVNKELKFATKKEAIQHLADITESRIKIAQDVPIYQEDARGDDPSDMYSSLRSIVKNNDGKWRSDKQANFIINKAKRGKTPNHYMKSTLNSKKPDSDADVIIITEMNYNPGGNFGKHGRLIQYAYWVDQLGVIQEAKIKAHHGGRDVGGASRGSTIEKITFTRPADLEEKAKALGEENKAKNKDWFDKNKEDVELVLKNLAGNDFFSRVINSLKNGEIPNEKWMDKAIEEAKHKDEHADAEPFPTERTKMTDFKIDVETAKETESSFEGRISYQIALIGRVPGYAEKGYIKIGQRTFEKWMDKAGVSNFKDVEGKTLTLKGTFNSNGKMIFGSRVNIVKMEDNASKAASTNEELKFASIKEAMQYLANLTGERITVDVEEK